MLEETFIVEILSNVKTFSRIKSFDKRMHLRFCISICPARLVCVCVYVPVAQADPGQYVCVCAVYVPEAQTHPGQCVCMCMHAVYISVAYTDLGQCVCMCMLCIYQWRRQTLVSVWLCTCCVYISVVDSPRLVCVSVYAVHI